MSMRCPKCNAKAACLDSRATTGGATRRRYECRRNHRWSTMEFVVNTANKHATEKRPFATIIAADVSKAIRDELRAKLLAALDG